MEDYIFSCGPEKRRSGTLNAKKRQMIQSNNTEAENLEHDFIDMVAKKNQGLGCWGDGKRQTRCWVGEEEEEEEELVKFACLPLGLGTTV